MYNIRVIKNRLDVYLKNNYYAGCADPTASNYVSYANVFDKNLCNYQTSFYFGGLYTESNHGSFQVPNILTQELSCPNGFEKKELLHLEFQGAYHSSERCHHKWFKKHCHTESWYDSVTTDTYICVSKTNQTFGMYFGGIYTDQVMNDITQDKTCPYKYISFPIYHNYAQTQITTV